MYPGWVTAKLFQFRSRDDQGYTHIHTHRESESSDVWMYIAVTEWAQQEWNILHHWWYSRFKQLFGKPHCDVQWPGSICAKRYFKQSNSFGTTWITEWRLLDFSRLLSIMYIQKKEREKKAWFIGAHVSFFKGDLTHIQKCSQ